MTRLAALVGKSVFPEEVPGIFSTKQLQAFLGATKWALPRLDSPTHAYSPQQIADGWPEPRRLTSFSIPKRFEGRRAMHVACPETQMQVCGIIDKRWKLINRLLGSSRLTLAELTYDETADLANWRHYDDATIREQRHARAAGHRATLRADIASYYPSIYTHSIPWSVLGKAASRVKKNKSHWSNMLDAAVRHSQDRHSTGLPAGLLSSHVAAELLGCAIDRDLAKAHKVVGSRQVDDFVLHLPDDVAVTALRSTLQSVLAKYNLYVNEAKTRIEAGSPDLVPAWVVDLEAVDVSTVTGRRRSHEVAQAMASRIYRLKKKNAGAPIFKKALPKVAAYLEANANPGVGDTTAGIVLNAIAFEPEASAEILSVIAALGKAKMPVDPGDLAVTINNAVRNALPLHHSGEVMHLLWIARNLKLKIDPKSWGLFVRNPNVLVAVQVLEMVEAGLFKASLKQQKQLVAATRALEDHQDCWLLDYEGTLRGWPQVSWAPLSTFFEVLRAAKVSFLAPPT